MSETRTALRILMGGPSFEHEVSLVSGKGMVRSLDTSKYDLYPVKVTREKVWIWNRKPLTAEEAAGFDPAQFFERDDLYLEKSPALNKVKPWEMTLLAFHGAFGEDGRIQSLLENWNLPYTGSGVLGSALAMNKLKAKEVVKSWGVPTADFRYLHYGDDIKPVLEKAVQDWGWPLVIKDPQGGSSIGMGIISDMEEALHLCEKLFANCRTLLLEQFIKGTEVSCGFLEGFKPLPATEIVPKTAYFDFEAKYQGKSEEITPARISASVMTKVQEYAELCHRALCLDVYSRTDFLICGEDVFFLETNTLPGFTPHSLLPQQAAAEGLSYAGLLEHILQKSILLKR